jgi:hypothetical protein
VLSDAARSFNSIHDRAKRCETEHIQDRSWTTDEIARQHGLDIDEAGFAKALWDSAHQSFALARPERPYYVAGPDDDAARVLRQLEAVGGPNSFEYVVVEE